MVGQAGNSSTLRKKEKQQNIVVVLFHYGVLLHRYLNIFWQPHPVEVYHFVNYAIHSIKVLRKFSLDHDLYRYSSFSKK